MKWTGWPTIVFGIAGIAVAAPATAQELVTNGGFETGDLTGWTTTGSVVASTYSPHSGAYDVDLYTPCCNTLSQTIATTANQQYTLNFYYNILTPTPNQLQVSFGGTQVFSAMNLSMTGYQLQTLTVTANGATSALTFTAGTATNNDDILLDDISLVASNAPEPAAWMLMIAGFGTAGSALRRRSAIDPHGIGHAAG